ncbi:unnamed protein product [Mytilus edulis]|uniref:Uncharacterized protein n=1 Tax=Mytilus edulis TaxID=6550 RepID=A0A8S3USL4_MYTED|nr:unnamed protein product [Mytilus edulis]
MFSLDKKIHDVTGYITWNEIKEIETNPPLQLEILLNQLKLLKAARYYYQEIQFAQSKVLEAFRDDECILLLHQYQCAIEKYGKNPPRCEEAPELNIFQEKKKDDIVAQQDLAQKQLEEHLKKEVYLKTNEAQILSETVHLMSENAKCLKAKCERISMESVSLNFQRLSGLTNYKEIEKMCFEHEQCLVAVFRILNLVSWKKDNASLMKALQASKKENDDLLQRLSQVAGAKLVAGNSSIADLGDKYRPTRIAELYSELYDNEWTEAVDTLLNGNRWPEDMIIRHLFIILQGCYKACCQLASQQIQDLVQKLYFDLSSADVSTTKVTYSHTNTENVKY